MRPTRTSHSVDRHPNDSGASTLIEYVMISGVLMVLLCVIMLLLNFYFVQQPTDTMTYAAFTDIDNGVSTRMVDTYALAPERGDLISDYDIPDDILGHGYFVEVNGVSNAQEVTISRGAIISTVALAGIGASAHGQSGGNTSGAGVNAICYNSTGSCS